MIAYLHDGAGREVGRINFTSFPDAVEFIATNWLPILAKGYTITVTKIW